MRSSLPKKLYGDTHSTASDGKSLSVWREKEKCEKERSGRKKVKRIRRTEEGK